MTIQRILIAVAGVTAGTWLSGNSIAAQGQDDGPPPEMGFFVTSVGLGDGGNLGGLAGADAHCQSLADAAGSGNRTWRAYLSTQGPGAVNARDRIGSGPWANAEGLIIGTSVGNLHYDNSNINWEHALDENGNQFASRIDGDPDFTEHDVLTGSQLDGTVSGRPATRARRTWRCRPAPGASRIPGPGPRRVVGREGSRNDGELGINRRRTAAPFSMSNRASVVAGGCGRGAGGRSLACAGSFPDLLGAVKAGLFEPPGSFHPKCAQRVEFRRAPTRNVASQQGDHEEQQGNREDGCGIHRIDAVELIRDEPGGAEGPADTIPSPIRTTTRPSPSTSRRMSLLPAPKVIRMPNSCLRCSTAYEMTP